MKILAVIPARGGSKGVKDKNIRRVLGKPLIGYAIEVAKTSSSVDQVIVNTDSVKISEIARSFGVEVINRPKEMGSDNASITPVLLQTLDVLEDRGQQYDILILLQVTSPIRTAQDIDNVAMMFRDDNDLESVVSVVKVDDSHPARMYSINSLGSLIPNDIKLERNRRQDLPSLYIRNGCIYAIKTKTLREKREIINDRKKAYVMPFEYALNIDSERDLLIAEVLMKEWRERMK